MPGSKVKWFNWNSSKMGGPLGTEYSLPRIPRESWVWGQHPSSTSRSNLWILRLWKTTEGWGGVKIHWGRKASMSLHKFRENYLQIWISQIWWYHPWNMDWWSQRHVSGRCCKDKTCVPCLKMLEKEVIEWWGIRRLRDTRISVGIFLIAFSESIFSPPCLDLESCITWTNC